MVYSRIYSLGIVYIIYVSNLKKGGNINHGYEQKLHYRNMVNTQKVRNFIRGVAKGTASVLHS